MCNCVWVLRQTSDHLLYRILGEIPSSNLVMTSKNFQQPASNKGKKLILNSNQLYSDTYYENLLKEYFRLDIDLESYYKQWTKAHKHFAKQTNDFYAVRVLNQDPIENLFSFICSQNNNITRITSMVEKLCIKYGSFICKSKTGKDYYTFPDIHILAKTSVRVHPHIT